jgi:hypothetical protein
MNTWLLLLLIIVVEPMLLCQRSFNIHAAAAPRRLPAAGTAAAVPAHQPLHTKLMAARACSTKQGVAQAVLDAVARPPVSAVPAMAQQRLVQNFMYVHESHVRSSWHHHHPWQSPMA